MVIFLAITSTSYTCNTEGKMFEQITFEIYQMDWRQVLSTYYFFNHACMLTHPIWRITNWINKINDDTHLY